MADPSHGSQANVSSAGSSTESGVEPADADFLFHLYRGSEMLRDNKVREAKYEIESALRLQPRDSQGQDLLARVYFRLGVYPRAIALYEAMVADFPSEVSPRINLALCYLKTGQPELARQHLEAAVASDPTRARAWGYLGLALERLGDLDKARAAFERGGHHAMVRRLDELLGSRRAADQEQAPPSSTTPVQLAEVRRVAEEAFHELDMSDMAFSLDEGLAPRAPADAGAWRPLEMGHDAAPMSARAASRPSQACAAHLEPPDAGSPREIKPHRTVTPLASELVRESELVFPKPGRVSKRDDGTVLVTVDGEFACRLDLARAMSTSVGMPSAVMLRRRGRGGDSEPPLGDPIRPLFMVGGAAHVVLCTVRERALHTLDLRDDLLVVREEALAGFDPRLVLESGRLPSGHGDMAPMAQLRGSGSVVLETRGALGTLELRGAQSTLVRGASLVGWLGRCSVRNVPLSEAPASARGWLAFTGEGWLLVDASPGVDYGTG